ncbi:ABC transporter permease [Bacillus sp. S13(2024)]|uniref:ABC transporter permease n=1 Tax=unclassified Bacillus (in: firmicutes) TaxID=185979 RepID=UPI003D20029E
MRELIKLELKKVDLKTYLIATVAITAVLLGLITLLGYVSHNEGDVEMQNFTFYKSLIPLGQSMILVAFGVLSSVMYSKIIVEAYNAKQATLLFMYPISRRKMMIAKLVSVYIFVFCAYLLSSLFIFPCLILINSILHFMSDSFVLSYLLNSLIQFSLLASSIGVISVGIGFIKKSVPTTILSSVILGSIFCNIVFNLTNSANVANLFNLFLVLILIGAVVSTFFLTNNVKKMEV